MARNDAAAREKISAALKRVAQDPEWRRQNSEARKGKPSRGGHVVAHVQKNDPRPNTCIFCREEQEADRG